MRYISLVFGLFLTFPALADTDLQSAARTQLKQFDTLLAYIDNDLNHSVFEPEKLATTLGPDPDNIERYIQANIALRPYWGALRGPRGVLIDRMGNSLDRSLLAIELLQRNGFETRLGHAIVEGVALDALVSITQQPIPDPPSAFNFSPELLAAFMTDGWLDPVSIRAAIAEAEDIGKQGQEEDFSQAQAFNTAMGNVLQGIDPITMTGLDQSQLAELFWPEYLDENGVWRVLEILPVTVAKLLSGRSEYQVYSGVETLPATLFHFFELQVDLVVVRDGKTELESLATTTMNSMQALEEHLSISNTLDVAEAQDVRAGIDDDSVFNFSIVQGENQSSVRYNLRGEIFVDGLQAASSQGLTSATSALENMFSPLTNPEAETTANHVAGLKLTYKISNSAGIAQPQDVRVFTRDIMFDGFLPSWSARMSILPVQMTGEYFGYRSLRSIIAQLRIMAFGFREGVAPTHLGFDPYLHHAWPAAQIPLVAANLNAMTGRTQGYVDQLAVVVEEANLRLDDNDLVLANSIDLVQIADRNSDPASHSGVTWNLAEQMVLNLPEGFQSGGFAQTLIAGSSDPARRIALTSEIDALNLPPITSGQMRADLQNGFEILLLKNDGSIWMSRDKITGVWIGRGLDGRGDAEYLKLLDNALLAFEGVTITVDFVFCVGGAISSNDTAGNITLCVLSTGFNVLSIFAPPMAIVTPLFQAALCSASDRSRAFCIASAATGITSGLPANFSRAGTANRYTRIFSLIGSVSRLVFAGASLSPLTAEDAR